MCYTYTAAERGGMKQALGVAIMVNIYKIILVIFIAFGGLSIVTGVAYADEVPLEVRQHFEQEIGKKWHDFSYKRQEELLMEWAELKEEEARLERKQLREERRFERIERRVRTFEERDQRQKERLKAKKKRDKKRAIEKRKRELKRKMRIEKRRRVTLKRNQRNSRHR